MNLLSWLWSEHPFLRMAQERVLRFGPSRACDIDDLVVRARLPIRTVLLAIKCLEQTGQLSSVSELSGKPLRQRLRPRDGSVVGTKLADAYVRAVAHRAAPALLWGQRRLTPGSAVARAQYVLGALESTDARIAFLGDDDCVSPIVAAAAPESHVAVLDIDRAVLDDATIVAEALGAELACRQADLSQVDVQDRRRADIVVCDPCPTADGSFEAMFWAAAAEIVRPGGILITTIAPSHKPVEFSHGALQQLKTMGFSIADIQEDFGEYEVFDFELLSQELAVLERYGWRATVSQTKSLSKSRHTHTRQQDPVFDFGRWVAQTTAHYLTVQAGCDEQRDIVRARGMRSKAGDDVLHQGLSIERLLPDQTGDDSEVRAAPPGERVEAMARRFRRRGVALDDAEREALVRLSTGSDLAQPGAADGIVWLGLALRAIESWERGACS